MATTLMRSPIHDDLDRLTRGLFGTSLLAGPSHSPAPPMPADVLETDDAIVVTVDMPGVADEDVDVQVDGGMLTVSAARRRDESDGHHRLSERMMGRMSRRWRLSSRVDVDGIAAELDRGVLTVTVPKAPEARPRRIPLASSSRRKR